MPALRPRHRPTTSSSRHRTPRRARSSRAGWPTSSTFRERSSSTRTSPSSSPTRITAGVGGGNYGVDQPTLRQQMAVFLLKAKHGLCYIAAALRGHLRRRSLSLAPSPTGSRLSRPRASREAAAAATTARPTRCGETRWRVFLLKAKHGSSYTPPACTGIFSDVPCPSPVRRLDRAARRRGTSPAAAVAATTARRTPRRVARWPCSCRSRSA